MAHSHRQYGCVKTMLNNIRRCVLYQKNYLAMGSPISSVEAEIFLKNERHKLLSDKTRFKEQAFIITI